MFHTCISRRAKDVEVCFKTSSRGTIQHLAFDATGLKVYSEGEWKVKKHGTDGKRRVWRQLHLAVGTDTHENIAAELTLSGMTDAEVFLNLLKQTRRAFKEISGDGAYDTRDCHSTIRVKKTLLLAREQPSGARDIQALAVGCYKLYWLNKTWKHKYGYYKVHFLKPLCFW